MLNRFSEWLIRVSSGWVIAVALLIMLLFTALVLPAQSAQSAAETGEAGSPDTSFLYSADDLYGLAEAYGEQGRAAYIRARFSFDLVWPVVYTLFLATGLSWTMARGFAPTSVWRRANMAPVAAMLFDYLENVATSLVMARYPDPTAVVDLLAPVLTLAKWGLISVSFLLAIDWPGSIRLVLVPQQRRCSIR